MTCIQYIVPIFPQSMYFIYVLHKLPQLEALFGKVDKFSHRFFSFHFKQTYNLPKNYGGLACKMIINFSFLHTQGGVIFLTPEQLFAELCITGKCIQRRYFIMPILLWLPRPGCWVKFARRMGLFELWLLMVHVVLLLGNRING